MNKRNKKLIAEMKLRQEQDIKTWGGKDPGSWTKVNLDDHRVKVEKGGVIL